MKKILKKTLSFTKFENAIECIRIYLGIALFFKGIHFMIHPQDLVYFLNQGDLDVIEAFVSHYVISAHLIGGLMLGIGLLSRVGAAIQLPVLSGALGLVHSKESLFSTTQNIELTALVLFLLLVFTVIGSGNISLDYHLLKDNSKSATFFENFLKKLIRKL